MNGDTRIPLILAPSMRTDPKKLAVSLRNARHRARTTKLSFHDVARAQGLSEDDILADLAPNSRLPNPVQADTALLDRLGVETALSHGLLPVARLGATTLLASDGSRSARRGIPMAEARLGPLSHCHATRGAIHDAIISTKSGLLSRRAETRTPPDLSCRDWSRQLTSLVLAAAIAFGTAAALNAPTLFVLALTIWATVTLAALTALRALAAFLEMRHARKLGQTWRSCRELRLPERHLPKITLLIPLFQEERIAGQLLKRLARLDYPRERLEILLILEAEDEITRRALSRSKLPPECRVIHVPPGSLRTKPRAMNYALDFAQGSIVGIYDAEDAPAPDQLHRVALRFHHASADVGCLQGVLDFYNPHASWLTRCFAIDYATWFRLVLPGLVRLGLPIPLGGTTVFFRREVLLKVGRWDAHNVTEDADLGLRLARLGYRTEFVASVTEEEATASIPAWVRQRSRWIKGYAVTWAVHMRQPLRLWRDLGPLGFLSTQILFLGTLSQFILAPLLWSFWVVPFGLPHPVTSYLSWPVFLIFAAVFLLSELATLAIAALSVATPRRRWLIWWVPMMHLYWPLAAVASWKSFAELVTRPFFWDKTAHGLTPDPDAPPPPHPA